MIKSIAEIVDGWFNDPHNNFLKCLKQLQDQGHGDCDIDQLIEIVENFDFESYRS